MFGELWEVCGVWLRNGNYWQIANIYASEYKLYLPDKKLLQEKLKEWLAEEGVDTDEI